MIWLDCETFSRTPIAFGTAAYVRDATVILLAYAKDDGPVKVWEPEGEPLPEDLKAYLASEDLCCAHNAAFDAALLQPLLGISFDRWVCSMAKCYAHGLPGSLEKAGLVLGLPQEKQKLKEGRSLVLFFCTPKGKKKDQRPTKESHPERWAKFKAYCAQDVEAMREVWKRSPSWNYPDIELDFWRIDQIINRRGVATDLVLASAAVALEGEEKESLAERTKSLTSGAVSSATRRDLLLRFISETYDLPLADMKSNTVTKLLEDPDLPPDLRELLATRIQANRNSSAKYRKILTWQTEGRLRYLFQYCGASRTLRFAGRGIQGQNLKRPEKNVADQWELAVGAVKTKSVGLFFDDPTGVLASLVRGAFVAERGKKLIVADLAGIEGCVLPWLAGEEAELARIREQRSGKGYDAYIWAYAKSFGVPPATVTKEQRKIGKPISLSFGFGGGASALVAMAAIYGVDLDAMAKHALGSLPAWSLAEADGMWAWAEKDKDRFRKISRGLQKETFLVCDALKRVWRRDHPRTEEFWADLEGNFRLAVEQDATDFTCGRIVFRRDGKWLRVLLPCGTYLSYPAPRVEGGKLKFKGIQQVSRKWADIETFGGRLAENMTSGTARGVLKDGIIAAEKAGYAVVLHSHDEIVAEVPDTEDFSVEGLCRLMTVNSPWAEGLPLMAAGFEAYRYRKD